MVEDFGAIVFALVDMVAELALLPETGAEDFGTIVLALVDIVAELAL